MGRAPTLAATSGKGGCYAFFLTVRPRAGITDECIELCKKYADKASKYSLIVIEKEGTQRHAHWFLFPHHAQQRSNVVAQTVKHVLKPAGFDEAELANFRMYRKDGSAAVLTLTSIAFQKYVDGTYEGKQNDKFEIVYNTLPEDLNILESYIPGVGDLARKKNLKFWTLEQQMQEHFNLPPRGKVKLSLAIIQRCFYSLENQDVREVVTDPRIAKNIVTRFHRWYNQYDHDDSYSPSCRGEIQDIKDAMLAEIEDDPN